MQGGEFDRLSPAELRAMCEWWNQREMFKDHRAGVLACAIVNCQIPRDSGVEPFSPWDFFPSLERLKPQPPSAEQVYAELRARLCS